MIKALAGLALVCAPLIWASTAAGFPCTLEALLTAQAAALNRRGEARFDAGKYVEATEDFAAAEAVRREVHLHERDRHRASRDELELQLKQASAIPEELRRKTVVSGRTVALADTLNLLKEAALALEDEATARACLDRTVELARASGDRKDEGDAVTELGDLEAGAMRLEPARKAYERALELQRAAGNVSPNVLQRLCQIEFRAGNVEQSEKWLVEALTRARTLAAPTGSPSLQEFMTRASALANLGVILSQEGLYQASLGRYKQARDYAQEIHWRLDEVAAMPRSSELGHTLVNAVTTVLNVGLLKLDGQLKEAVGDEAGALACYQKGLASVGGQTGLSGWLRLRMAKLAAERGDFVLARASVQEALRIASRDHSRTALVEALFRASRVERAAGDPAAALRMAAAAREMCRALRSPLLSAEADEIEADALKTGPTGNTAAVLDRARTAYTGAISRYRELHLAPAEARALASLADVEERAEKPAEAMKALDLAIACVERSASELAQDAGGMLGRKDINLLYLRMVALLNREGRTREAMQYAERSRAQALAAARTPEALGTPGSSAQVATVTAARARTEELQRAIARERERAASDPAVQSQLAAELAAQRTRYTSAVKEVEARHPGLDFTVRPLNLLALQSRLGPDEGVLQYMVAPNRVFIFVMTRTQVVVRECSIAQQELWGLVRRMRQLIATRPGQQPEPAEGAPVQRPILDRAARAALVRTRSHELGELLSFLHDLLVGPVEDLLKDVRALYVVPHGDLFYVPFAALRDAKGTSLVQKFRFSCVAESELLRTVAKAAPGARLVAFGNPAGAELPEAAAELEALRKLFPGAQVFPANGATKRELFQVKTARILHLATHGRVDAAEPMNSELMMAPAGVEARPNLGVLDIYLLPLADCDLVVLSACSTALAGSPQGTDIGILVEAFRSKARAIVASLWPVDDAATRALMTAFYGRLAKGVKPAEALRAAQDELRGDPRLSDPFFWAAFVLYAVP